MRNRYAPCRQHQEDYLYDKQLRGRVGGSSSQNDYLKVTLPVRRRSGKHAPSAHRYCCDGVCPASPFHHDENPEMQQGLTHKEAVRLAKERLGNATSQELAA